MRTIDKVIEVLNERDGREPMTLAQISSAMMRKYGAAPKECVLLEALERGDFDCVLQRIPQPQPAVVANSKGVVWADKYRVRR